MNILKKFIVPAIGVLLVIANPPLATAQQRFVQGQGQGDSKESALAKAKESAWKAYLGRLQGPKLDNVLANEANFLKNIDSVLVDVLIVDEKCSGGLFKSECALSIKATVNETVIDSQLRAIGKSGSGGKVSQQDDVALLVMARMAKSQVGFDVKETKRAESTVATTGTSASTDVQSSSRSGSAEASADAASVTQSSKTVTGGSREAKADRIEYIPWANINDLQNRVGEALNNNRIGTVPWEELVNNCGVSDGAPFSKAYAESETGQLPPALRADIFRKLRECQITKIIIASIDIDGYRTDPNTGLWLATGNMNIQAFDITGRFGRSIGSANRPVSGRAQQLNDAGRLALGNAAKAAAEIVVNQFNLR